MPGPPLFPSAIAAFLFTFAPHPARACDSEPRPARDAERHARAVFRQSSAIIDAVVVVPQAGASPARLRPLRILKGPTLPAFLVVPEGSCDIYLAHRVAPVRLVLAGGPRLFTADMSDNGLDFGDGRGRRRFDAELDRLVGVRRPPGTAGLNVEQPPPR